MKYILTLLMLIGIAHGQTKTDRGGPANTVSDDRVEVERNLFLPRYADTTAANLDKGIDSLGALIWTRAPFPGGLWVRQINSAQTNRVWTLYGTGATPPPGSNRDIPWNDAGTFNATSAFQYTTSGYLKLANGGLTFLPGADNGATTLTNNTAKTAIFAFPHYAIAEENVMFVKMQSFSGTNSLQIGGSDAAYNSVNDFRIYLGATATSTTGAEALRGTNTGWYFGAGTNPSSKIHIAAGTTTVAPLQFTAGTNNTTAAAGRVEYDGTNLYFTPTGTTRKRLPIINNATPSNGQLPIGNGTDFTVATPTSSGGTITWTLGAGTLNADIASSFVTNGTYTPTLTNGANIVSTTQAGFTYTRIGDVVTVYGSVGCAFTTGATNSVIDISLPIASNIGNLNDLLGTAVSIGPDVYGTIVGSVANDRAVLTFTSPASGSPIFNISFRYKII